MCIGSCCVCVCIYIFPWCHQRIKEKHLILSSWVDLEGSLKSLKLHFKLCIHVSIYIFWRKLLITSSDSQKILETPIKKCYISFYDSVIYSVKRASVEHRNVFATNNKYTSGTLTEITLFEFTF